MKNQKFNCSELQKQMRTYKINFSGLEELEKDILLA